jgi:hypothetical protein
MTPIIWGVLGTVLVISLWKLRRTFRSVRSNRGQEIREELTKLRKKRDEQ